MNQTHILLINLGSPDTPSKKSIRSYLKQFLSDPRVVDLPRWLWLPILHLIILNFRAQKLVKIYQSIWGNNKNSPLVTTCQNIVDLINAANNQQNCSVSLAMCYGKPAINSVLKSLGQIKQLVILPMYPQYSSATTAAVFDAVAKFYCHQRVVPNIKLVNDYHDNELYIQALADSVNQHWQQQPPAQKLIIAFHGIPQRYVDTGDIYQTQCQNTAQLLAKKLSLTDNQWQIAYQSRFGKEVWLQPYLDQALLDLTKQNIKSVDIISPGFSADCLETLAELAIETKQKFLANGGEQYHYIPALNTNKAHLQMWQSIIERQSNFC